MFIQMRESYIKLEHCRFEFNSSSPIRAALSMAFQIDWKLFLSTLALIFVAELPDKTAFATLLLATRKHPLPIFIGVAMAFVNEEPRRKQRGIRKA
jgi:putative Ca2+/H+ antiporter (TMEM165/GDT1 family)